MSVLLLTIDGGGIRGVIPATILTELERQLNKPIYQMFDVLGGTSTGGIIAIGLSTPIPKKNTPYSASELLDFYMNDESQLFVPQHLASVENTAKYYSDNGQGRGIEPWLQEKLGPITLKECAERVSDLPSCRLKQVFTTSYMLNQQDRNGQNVNPPEFPYGHPYLFSWSAAQNATDNYYSWEAARGTSAAPTYFPFAKVGGGGSDRNSMAILRWVVDGGVTANNPMLYAISEAFRISLASSLDDITLISLGTGYYPGGSGVSYESFHSPTFGDGNWGKEAWVGLQGTNKTLDLNGHETTPLVDVLTYSNQVSPTQVLSTMLPPDRFLRLEPTISYAHSKLDATDTTALQKIASDYISNDPTGSPIFQKIVSTLKK